jgi:hypothetical protein
VHVMRLTLILSWLCLCYQFSKSEHRLREWWIFSSTTFAHVE